MSALPIALPRAGNAFWSAYTAWHVRAEARLPFRPLERLLARRDGRVRAMVAHAYATVPYYREVMDAAGLQPRDIRGADDLARLPLLTGADLAREPQRFRSRRYTDDRVLALRSSGTSGHAKAITYDAAALFLALAHGHRQRHVLARFVGKTYGYREMHVVREHSVAHQLRAFYESRSWVPGRLELDRSRASPAEAFEQTLGRITAYRPDVVRGYGAHLGALFRFAVDRGVDVHRPRCVVYGADRMADGDRAIIETQLGVPVLSTYQAAEALRIGFQCEERRGFHVSLDHVALRVVDGRGAPVGPGGRGEVVISNLVNRATVLLNYRLGDVVTVAASGCPCGRTLPVIEAIEGRADDFVVAEDGRRVHAVVVLAPLLRVAGVLQLQVIQETPGRFRISVVAARDSAWPAVGRELTAALRAVVGASAAVDLERAETIPPEPSGKFRSVISRCDGRAE